MQTFLLFDAGCMKCSEIAKFIDAKASGKLELVGLGEDRAREMLDQARPKGWEYIPFLVQRTEDGIRASSGISLVWRLVQMLGPRRAASLLRLLPQAATANRDSGGVDRRQFIKLGGVVAAGASYAALVNPVQALADCTCFDCFCGGSNSVESNTCGNHFQSCRSTCIDDPCGPDHAIYYAHYNRCGDYCYDWLRYLYCCDCGTCI